MWPTACNNKGQSVLAEHVMIFFVVIAALVAMTTFVQRGFEARIHDARNFMINAVANSSVCDANCVAAAGGQISHEYEPYYAKQLSDVQTNSTDTTGATSPTVNWSIGARHIHSVNEETQTNSTSAQLPAKCANGGC